MKTAFLTLLSFVCYYTITAQEKEFKPVKYPEHYTAALNTSYVKTADWDGKVDLYYNTTAETPTPIVINIHGGGWRRGVKESQRGFGSFFKRGYAVANISYRLSQKATAPAAVEDARCVLVYLHKNAKKLNIDPNKIVVMGGSAGGHLALMTGLLGNNKQFDTNCPCEEDIKVAAIIDKYGPNDLTKMKWSRSVKIWLDKQMEDERFVESVSPIFLVSPTSPPTFIIHGTLDPSVPYEQSKMLYATLLENEIKAELMTVEDGVHGKFSKEVRKEFSKRMWDFLDSIITTD